MPASWSTFDDSITPFRPSPVVKWLLILNFGFFFLQKLFALTGNGLFQEFLQLDTWHIRQGCLWQFVTYMFLHGSILHLLVNLLMLFFFGNEVEHALGSGRFLQVYLLGGLVGGLLWFAFNFRGAAAMVGASGAVYAVVIAFATLYPHRPITLLVFFVLPITLAARVWAVIAVALSLLFTISGEGGSIAHLAHLGGMAVGFLYVRALALPSWRSAFTWPFPRRNTRPRPVPVPHLFQKEDFMQKRIDPILDKIAEHGIHSLSREERRILEEAKDHLS